MSGKPAARQGDATAKGGPIVQGSAGVRIGAPTGVACSVCPGGMTTGEPVNPLLGAKVLPDEVDVALEGGWNLYSYPLNPIADTDPLGLFVPVLVGIACGLVFDYALDKWKETHCKDPDADTVLGPEGNAATGATAGAFGPYEYKPRGGIAGGGPAGDKTSTYSKTLHNAYKNKVISKGTTKILRDAGRKVAKSIPYVGSAIVSYEVYDASNCDD